MIRHCHLNAILSWSRLHSSQFVQARFLANILQKEPDFLFCRHVSRTVCPGVNSKIFAFAVIFAFCKRQTTNIFTHFWSTKKHRHHLNLKPNVTTYTLYLYCISWTLTSQPCDCISRKLTLKPPSTLLRHHLHLYIRVFFWRHNIGLYPELWHHLTHGYTSLPTRVYPKLRRVHSELWRHLLYCKSWNLTSKPTFVYPKLCLHDLHLYVLNFDATN